MRYIRQGLYISLMLLYDYTGPGYHSQGVTRISIPALGSPYWGDSSPEVRLTHSLYILID